MKSGFHNVVFVLASRRNESVMRSLRLAGVFLSLIVMHGLTPYNDAATQDKQRYPLFRIIILSISIIIHRHCFLQLVVTNLMCNTTSRNTIGVFK